MEGWHPQMPPDYSSNRAAGALQSERKAHVRAAQIRLLYENANTGIAVTIVAAPALAYLQWFVVQRWILLSWLTYMLLVSAARFVLTHRYRRSSGNPVRIRKWGGAFAFGAGLAGAGWGAAGILLYPREELTNQMFLVFVLGGMMLGAASILAARPEAFVAFLVPTGMLPAIRFVFGGDMEHVTMGFLATVFTGATVITTWRFHRTIESSLNLQFQNQALVLDLQTANTWTEALNQQLELRVRDRTSELRQSNVRLRAEIEQREKMEEELLRVRNLESLGVLAGGIAHDFNNFLTIVQGNIELAKMQLDSDASVQTILDDSAAACQRATFLSSQLLTFAKGGAPIRRVVSVAKLILDAVHLARAGAPVSIGIDTVEDLWCAEVDAGQISQVLHNLLLNAKQAMPEGGIIDVRAENVVQHDNSELRPERYVRISIRDHGPGIAPEILPKIFDPYFTTKRTGSGLGLATTYAIVAKHGGTISVNSQRGMGTEFIILLPASRENPAPESPVGAPLRRGAGKLLVMDDEEALRTLWDRSLTKLGYEVQSACDGAEAIALYESAKASGRVFDAVVLDLTVSGGMGGVETAARLRELDPSVKLIVSSGYSDASIMSKFREYGFDDVIPKPWQAAQISEVFQRVLVDTEREIT
jgi:signal transduction histidine kinase/ActR/RegA family two-component response regulator